MVTVTSLYNIVLICEFKFEFFMLSGIEHSGINLKTHQRQRQLRWYELFEVTSYNLPVEYLKISDALSCHFLLFMIEIHAYFH